MLPSPWTPVVLRELGFNMSDREGKGIFSFSHNNTTLDIENCGKNNVKNWSTIVKLP
jgi:hypothetical protein